MGPEKAPIRPEKARFSRKDFYPIFSENLGLKSTFVSPCLDFPQKKSEITDFENSPFFCKNSFSRAGCESASLWFGLPELP